MAKLERANGVAGAEAPMNAPTMSCHLDQPGTTHEMRLCADWLAVRMAVIAGELPAQALAGAAHWPQLRENLEELVADRGSGSRLAALPDMRCGGAVTAD